MNKMILINKTDQKYETIKGKIGRKSKSKLLLIAVWDAQLDLTKC